VRGGAQLCELGSVVQETTGVALGAHGLARSPLATPNSLDSKSKVAILVASAASPVLGLVPVL
jgi:hypothetical protein